MSWGLLDLSFDFIEIDKNTSDIAGDTQPSYSEKCLQQVDVTTLIVQQQYGCLLEAQRTTRRILQKTKNKKGCCT